MSRRPQDAERRIWGIAGPSILANLSAALVGTVDTWAIGHLPEESLLAGLAVGAFVMTMIAIVLSFLRLGTTGLVAQAYGAGRRGVILRTTLRAIVTGVALGLALLALSRPIGAVAVASWALSGETAAAALTYLEIRFWGLPALLTQLSIIGFLIGVQRARAALLIGLVLNLTNLALTLWFVVGLGWGVAGAASASLIAEWFAGLSALLLVAASFGRRRLVVVLRQRSFWRPEGFRELTRVNATLLAHTLVLELVITLLSITGGRLGDEVLAANHVLLQLLLLASLCLHGIANAAQALIGAAKGAGDRALFHFWSLRTTLWALALSLAFVALYAAAGGAIVDGFTDIASVRTAAHAQFPWFAVLPLVAVWSYQIEGIFVGATGVTEMLAAMVCAALVFLLALWQLVPAYGNAGLWAAFALFLLARGLSLALFYPRLSRLVPRGA